MEDLPITLNDRYYNKFKEVAFFESRF